MLIMQCLSFCFLYLVEMIPGTLLSTFATAGLNWNINDGARLMSAYWKISEYSLIVPHETIDDTFIKY